MRRGSLLYAIMWVVYVLAAIPVVLMIYLFLIGIGTLASRSSRRRLAPRNA
jgi:hypothetical protein